MSGHGLGSELESCKGRKKKLKRSRGVNQRLKVGIRVGARVRGHVNTRKALGRVRKGGRVRLIAALLGNEVNSSWAS